MVKFRSGEGFSGKCGTCGGEFLEPAAEGGGVEVDLDGGAVPGVGPIEGDVVAGG